MVTSRIRAVAQTLTVNVRRAVAKTGKSHASFPTVTAAVEISLCAVAEVIAVCCPKQIIFLHWYLMIKKQRNKQSRGFNLIFSVFSCLSGCCKNGIVTINYWLSNILIITSVLKLLYMVVNFFYSPPTWWWWLYFFNYVWMEVFYLHILLIWVGRGGGGCWRKSQIV